MTPSQKRIRSYLGLINYYQHYVPQYSAVAKPLFSLLKGVKKKGKHGKSKVLNRKLTAADWTPAQEQAFEGLKAAIVNTVVLAHPDFSRPFMLSTDASLDGIGAVLSQIPEGAVKARPIAFASKSLSQSQRNYPAHRLEFLALKWAVCDKFSHWLKGHKFTVWTDNNPLTHNLTKPKLDCCEQCWVAKLASYDFDIKYVPGPQNVVADALSRVPFVNGGVGFRLLSEPFANILSEVRGVSSVSVRGVFQSSCDRGQPDSVSVDSLSGCSPVLAHTQSIELDDVSAIVESHTEWEAGARIRAVAALQYLPQLCSPGPNSLPAYTEKDLRDKQLEDNVLSRVLHFVERCRRPSRREKVKEAAAVIRYMKHWEKLVVTNGVLYRVSMDLVTKAKRFQYVVPQSLRDVVLQGVHDDAGHQGQLRSLGLTRQRFFWLNLDRDVRDYVRNCRRCIVAKTVEPEGRALLGSITSTRPMQLVCIDFWSAEDFRNKSISVLVVTDHFTRMAQAFPCKDQTAKQVAKVLWDRYFCVFGFPEQIHSDQGTSFESELISELLRVSGIKKSHTTPYHPMGNGSVERFNRTLGDMIRALTPDKKVDWPRRLQTLTFMYNCIVSESTGYAPFYLMFGRVPRLPIDVLFRTVLNDSNVTSFDKYVESLTTDLEEAMVIAQEHATKAHNRHAKLYNRRVKGSAIEVGDRVLIANRTERGKRKVADRWESPVYTVVDKNTDTHTYRICDTVTGLVKVVHRNLLMSVNFLPVDVSSVVPDSVHSGSVPSYCTGVSVRSLVEDSSGGGGAIPCDETDGSDGSGSSVSEGESNDSLAAPGAVDSEGRIRDWISQLSVSGLSQADVSDYGCELLRSHRGSEPPLTQPGGQSITCNPRSLLGSDVDVGDSESVAPTHFSSSHAAHTLEPNQAKSRYGRLIRPVNRLIQTMFSQDVVEVNVLNC